MSEHQIPGYQVIRALSSGGFGAVYLAIREADGLEVAIKLLHLLNDDHLHRFYREAKLLHQELNNPNVVNLVEARFDQSPPFIVMEFCSGGSLQSWVTERRNWGDVVIALAHAASGLSVIHAKGGFHRDIKPGNLLLVWLAPGQGIIKVGDFGLARVPVLSSKPMTRSAWGTEGYIAPEVLITGIYSNAADVYSLGITGIELLTGRRDPTALIGAPGPKSLHTFLKSMVNMDAEKRPTMAECAARLGESFEEAAYAVKVPTPVAKQSGAGKAFGFAALVGLGLALVGAATSNTKDANGRFHGRDGRFRGGRWW